MEPGLNEGLVTLYRSNSQCCITGELVLRTSSPTVSCGLIIVTRHAALSDADAKWMEYMIEEALGKDWKGLDAVTAEDFWKIEAVLNPLISQKDKKAKEWTFDGLDREQLKRGPDGKFKDADLAKIIKACVEEPAHAFGVRRPGFIIASTSVAQC